MLVQEIDLFDILAQLRTQKLISSIKTSENQV